jgi:hypothetical protein
MRAAIVVILFAVVVALVAVGEPAVTSAQDKKDEKKAQPKFDPPKVQKPDEATLKTIAEKTELLRSAVARLKDADSDVRYDVQIYLNAAENIVRFEEWYGKDSGKWALTTLDQGLARARQAGGGAWAWDEPPGKWVVRGYRSSVDGSVQPYAVLFPHDYREDFRKRYRLEIVLHGRDSSLTEAKFIATHQGAAPKDLDHVRLEVYGRGNNAYRWAGETDVWDARRDVFRYEHALIDMDRTVLRGFSMGGAGTWHIGLHNPSAFRAIGPGAGFTTTHGYVANLPKELPDYQEKCLRIYDAVDYAENVFNVPVVAYSGALDPQKQAADNIENALKSFKEPHKFTHLVAPGLAHQMPKEWQDKAEAELRKYAEMELVCARVRFVTYTPNYARVHWLSISALEKQYERALVDGTRGEKGDTIKTSNVRILRIEWDLIPAKVSTVAAHDVTIDGQTFKKVEPYLAYSQFGPINTPVVEFEKRDGRWVIARGVAKEDPPAGKPIKRTSVCGPIDDAFCSAFMVVKPEGRGFSPLGDRYSSAAVDQFAALWDKYFRGKLPFEKATYQRPKGGNIPHLVLFGDPESNPLIAKVLPKLPITWTKEKLVVNGVEYDPKTHVPVLIYPNPLNPRRYVVINSGHTFKEADIKGTNALLYPRLGDWAVIKPTPTDKDPAAYEVVAAGLFDENWQFPKKK